MDETPGDERTTPDPTPPAAPPASEQVTPAQPTPTQVTPAQAVPTQAVPTQPASAEGASRRPSRRWFVAGALAVIAGGGAGVALDFARGRPKPAAPAAAPKALIAALAHERVVLAAARTARRAGTVPAGIGQALVSDHEAHLAALTAAASAYANPTPSQAPTSTPQPADRAALRRLELQASTDAQAHARQLSGATAALLASISACEATHADLLS